MARQKLHEKKRSIMLGVKVTPELRNRIDSQAALECLTISSFIEKVISDYIAHVQCVNSSVYFDK